MMGSYENEASHKLESTFYYSMGQSCKMTLHLYCTSSVNATTEFLGAFAKFGVRPSVKPAGRPPEQPGSHTLDFHEILYLRIFWKICRGNSNLFKMSCE